MPASAMHNDIKLILSSSEQHSFAFIIYSFAIPSKRFIAVRSSEYFKRKGNKLDVVAVKWTIGSGWLPSEKLRFSKNEYED